MGSSGSEAVSSAVFGAGASGGSGIGIGIVVGVAIAVTFWVWAIGGFFTSMSYLLRNRGNRDPSSLIVGMFLHASSWPYRLVRRLRGHGDAAARDASVSEARSRILGDR